MNAHSDDFDRADDFRDLSQAYRDAAKHEDEPSPALDAAILAAAHRAVASRPQAVRQPSRLARWRLPLAMAASFLVGVFIVMVFVSEEAGPEPQILAQVPLPEWPQPSPAPMDEVAAHESLASAQIPPVAEPAAANMPIREKRAEISGDAVQDSHEKVRQLEESIEATVRGMRMTDALPAKPARIPEDASRIAMKAVARETEKNAMPAAQGLSAKHPQTWLEEIEKLRRDGKIKEARKALTEFRKRYPDHELPKALRDL